MQGRENHVSATLIFFNLKLDLLLKYVFQLIFQYGMQHRLSNFILLGVFETQLKIFLLVQQPGSGLKVVLNHFYS